MSLKNNNQARTYSRKRAVQLLYQWQLNPIPKDELIKEFMAGQEMERVDEAYFMLLAQEVIKQVDDLDEKLKPHMQLKLEELDPIEHAVLRLAMYELVYSLQIPYKVVINEAVNLAKTYGGEQGHAFVNAVLDKAVVVERVMEHKAQQKE